MKKDQTRSLFKGMVCIVILSLYCSTAYAQPWAWYDTPPSNSETVLANPSSYLTWLNNAEFKNTNGTVYAVTWTEWNTTSYFTVNDGVGSATLQLVGPGNGNVTDPDIVIGGDATNMYVGVVYTYHDNNGPTDIYLEVYTLSNVGSGVTISAPCGTNYYQISGSPHDVMDSHIDIINYNNSGANEADEICIAWEDHACWTGPGYGSTACHGSLSYIVNNCATSLTYLSGCINIPSPNANQTQGRQVDVAAYNWGSGNKATFTYEDFATGKLYIEDWDFANASVTTPATQIDIHPWGGFPWMTWPRIDVYDRAPAYGYAGINVAYMYYDIMGSTGQIKHYNDLSPTATATSNFYTAPMGKGPGHYNNYFPVVACGPNGSGNPDFFSMLYTNLTLDSVYLNNLDCSTGHLSDLHASNYFDFYSLNMQSGIEGHTALSNAWEYDSNIGDIQATEIFGCWYNSAAGEIDCKTSGSAPSFKPTNITMTGKLGNARIFPNPANDKIFITATNNVSSYRVLDLSGKLMQSGSIALNGQGIDVRSLASGTYIVELMNGSGIVEKQKFAKN